jgi:hypothetical protein
MQESSMSRKGPVFVAVALGLAVGVGYGLQAHPEKIPFFSPITDSGSGSVVTAPGSPVPPASKASASSPVPPSDNPLRYMLASVADQYEANSRYPAYSIPISEAQAKAYSGNHYDAITLPLQGGGEFTVTLEKYRFTRGNPIPVVATLNGPMVVGLGASATLESVESGEKNASVALESPEPGVFEGVLESDLEPGEYRLIVEGKIDGQPIRHVSTLSIEPFLGKFGQVGSAHVENNDLIIPVEFEPEGSGFFALSANLYADGQPIAHLSRELKLDNSQDVVELKAHGSVLAGKGVQGTMTLKGIQVRRLPKRPGDRTAFAFGPDDGFEFEAPNLDDLEDESARAPESEQRAALLRKLARDA